MPLESGVSSRDDVARTPPASLIADRSANNPWKSSGLPCRKSIGGNLSCPSVVECLYSSDAKRVPSKFPCLEVSFQVQCLSRMRSSVNAIVRWHQQESQQGGSGGLTLSSTRLASPWAKRANQSFHIIFLAHTYDFIEDFKPESTKSCTDSLWTSGGHVGRLAVFVYSGCPTAGRQLQRTSF